VRWSVFAIAAFIVIALQVSVREAFTLRTIGSISPDLVACLAAFVALFASRPAALWACWILGLAMDLAPAAGPTEWRIIGPHALGYVFGGYVALHLRGMVFRRRAVTTGFITFLFLLASGLVATLLLSIRHIYLPDTPLHGSPLGELWLRIKVALYSGLVGIPFGWLLQLTIMLWNFHGGGIARRGW